MKQQLLFSLAGLGLLSPAVDALTWNFRRDYYLPTDEYNEQAVMKNPPTEGGRLQLVSQAEKGLQNVTKPLTVTLGSTTIELSSDQWKGEDTRVLDEVDWIRCYYDEISGTVLNSTTSDFSQIYVLRKKKKSFQAFHLDITDPTRVSLANQFEMRPDDIVFVATQPLSLYSRTLSQILGSTGLTLQARDTIRTELGN